MFQFWNRCATVFLFAVVLGSGSNVRADESVTIEPQPDGLIVKIRGTEFTVFHYGSSFPKPYFWPVRASDGAILTRPIEPGEKEHPHHKGIWLSVDEVNDIKFWAEKGKIVTREVTSSSGNPAIIRLKNEWIGNHGAATLIERTKISIYPDRLITYDFTLSPPLGQLVRFDDTKEGLFGIRIAQSMREKEGGSVLNSDGKRTTQECWGQPAKWVDYSGSVDGKKYGVALMDHPNNFRPSRYHVRDYGLFSMSPFGEGAYQNDATKSKPVILDEVTPSIWLRYGLFVHDGLPVASEINEVYSQFVKTTSESTPR